MKNVLLLICSLVSFYVPSSIGSVVELTMVDSGWYLENGNPNYYRPGFYNYLCGNLGGRGPLHNTFFIFDLSGCSYVTDASLRLYTFDMRNSGNFQLYDVSTDIEVLLNNVASVEAFDDFEQGDLYGEIQIGASQDYQYLDIPLTAAAIASINNTDNLWAIGGTFISSGHAFGKSGYHQGNRLILTTRPNPPTADAGGPYTAAATGFDGGQVTLNGTGSTSSLGDVLNYEWDLNLAFDSDGDGNPGNDIDQTEAIADYIFPIGETEIALVVRNLEGFASEPDVTTVTVSTIDVAVDVKPGSSLNRINFHSHGVVPVAFMSDSLFDARTIDLSSLTLWNSSLVNGVIRNTSSTNLNPLFTHKDVDHDGFIDLVVKLETDKLGVPANTNLYVFGALTLDGLLVVGSDLVLAVPELKANE